MRDYGDEKVLIISKDVISSWEGVKTKGRRKILKAVSENAYFVPRSEAEGNPNVTQTIPYCLLCHTDNEGTRRLFHAQRKSEADRELKGKWTIGIGGHINPEDRIFNRLIRKREKVAILNIDNKLDQMLLNCAKRELNEELIFDWKDVEKIKFLGLVMSVEDLVSKDHLGIVLIFEMTTQNVRVRPEGEMAYGQFLTQLEFLILLDWRDFLLSIHTPEEIKLLLEPRS